MKYAGLTDDPAKIKPQRNSRGDFRIMQQFSTEQSARQWLSRMLGQQYEKDSGTSGWKYGYTYSTAR
jgi:hypothetical protein